MPGFYIVTTRVKRNAPFEKLIVRQRVRAGDDERHFAGNDVQQLGQFVEIEAAQEALRDDLVETERVARQIEAADGTRALDARAGETVEEPSEIVAKGESRKASAQEGLIGARSRAPGAAGSRASAGKSIAKVDILRHDRSIESSGLKRDRTPP